MDTWKIVGYENVISEKTQKPGIRLYVERPLQEGASGEGIETGRIFFRPEYVKYEPRIGDVILPVEGRYGIDRILRIS